MKFAWQIADGMSYLSSKNVSYSIGIFFFWFWSFIAELLGQNTHFENYSSSSAKEFLN